MKLRLENGNFKITGHSDTETEDVIFDNLPKDLSPEDFIGCVVDIDGVYSVVVAAFVNPENENVVVAAEHNGSITYNRLTGVVTAA